MTEVFFKRAGMLRDLRIQAVLYSIIISLWCLYADDVINNDGILYLSVAELISQGQWDAAHEQFKLPYYSALIAYLSMFSGLELETAAHALNVLFVAVIAFCFVDIVRTLGGDSATLVAALVVIVLFPGVNKYSASIVRDLGYAAGYIASLALLARFLKTPSWFLLLGSIGAITTAALFRSEGAVAALVIVAMLLLRQCNVQLSARSLFIVLPGLLGFSLMVVYIYWWGGDASSQAGIFERLMAGATSAVQGPLTVLEQQYLPRYSTGYAPTILVITFALILTTSVFSSLTLFYALLVIYAVKRKLFFSSLQSLPQFKWVWAWLVITQIIVLSGAVVKTMFITGRWPLVLSLTLLIAAPFALSCIWREWRRKRGVAFKENWLFPVVCALFLLTAYQTLSAFSGSNYMKDAGLWIKGDAPQQAEILSNNSKVTYYAGVTQFRGNLEWSDFLLRYNSAKDDYDYVAAYVRRKQPGREAEILRVIGKEPVQVFRGDRGGKVLIFQR